MSRDQWSVDDELSRLKDEIKGSVRQPKSAESGGPIYHGHHQHLEGDGNVQVAGDFILSNRKKIDPRSPKALLCPNCEDWTSKLCDLCDCGFNIKAHLDEQARKREKSRLLKIMLVSGISGLVIILVGTRFLTGTDVFYPIGLGGGLVTVAYLAGQRIDQISAETNSNHRR